jgi:hypothetical protein
LTVVKPVALTVSGDNDQIQECWKCRRIFPGYREFDFKNYMGFRIIAGYKLRGYIFK